MHAECVTLTPIIIGRDPSRLLHHPRQHDLSMSASGQGCHTRLILKGWHVIMWTSKDKTHVQT